MPQEISGIAKLDVLQDTIDDSSKLINTVDDRVQSCIQANNVSVCSLPHLNPEDIEKVVNTDSSCDSVACDLVDDSLNNLKTDGVTVDLNTSGEVVAFVEHLTADADFAEVQTHGLMHFEEVVESTQLQSFDNGFDTNLGKSTSKHQNKDKTSPESLFAIPREIQDSKPHNGPLERILKTIAEFSPPVKNVLYDVYIPTPGRSLLKSHSTVDYYKSPVFSSGGSDRKRKSVSSPAAKLSSERIRAATARGTNSNDLCPRG